MFPEFIVILGAYEDFIGTRNNIVLWWGILFIVFILGGNLEWLDNLS
jgi:hypothetical protein